MTFLKKCRSCSNRIYHFGVKSLLQTETLDADKLWKLHKTPKLRGTRSSTNDVNKYIIKKCKTTSRIWNCLADELDLSSSTSASLKSVIFNYYKSALAVVKTHVSSSLCLKCNSARSLSRPIICCV